MSFVCIRINAGRWNEKSYLQMYLSMTAERIKKLKNLQLEFMHSLWDMDTPGR